MVIAAGHEVNLTPYSLYLSSVPFPLVPLDASGGDSVHGGDAWWSPKAMHM